MGQKKLFLKTRFSGILTKKLAFFIFKIGTRGKNLVSGGVPFVKIIPFVGISMLQKNFSGNWHTAKHSNNMCD